MFTFNHKDDRGESSIMMMISLAVITLVSITSAGVLLTGGVDITAEFNAQSELTIADSAFDNDWRTADAVVAVDDTEMTFYWYGYIPEDDLNTEGIEGVCRTSTWKIEAASNEIRELRKDDTLLSLRHSRVLHSSAACTGMEPVSTISRVAVSAIASHSTITYKNFAGRDLVFREGVEPSLSIFEAEVAISEGDIDDWYTPTEVVDSRVRQVSINMDVPLPTTNMTDATMTGAVDVIIEPIGEGNGDSDVIFSEGVQVLY